MRVKVARKEDTEILLSSSCKLVSGNNSNFVKVYHAKS